SAEGAVSVMGVNPSHLDEGEEKHFYTKLGVFYQNGALLNSLTVGENVALPLQQHTDLPEEMIERLVRLKLRLVNLEGTYNMLPSSLSGGMLKRAALARAIIMDPPILFCDEPGSGLDPVSLASLDNLILNLQKLLGITIIMITHEVSSIFRVADRIVFIDKGRLIFEGTLDKALSSDNKALKEFFRKGRGE
ncbi:MAG TPA: ABC transporter ATP-binding protein, partial [Bacteroidales bacterium]|nr:ABC transporter ATP-binding protein [Bacteroidales bacterium]